MNAGFIKSAPSAKTTTPIIPVDFTHCEIIGQTGCGKTSSVILPNIDHRIGLNHACLVYDFKGSLASKVKAIAKKYGRFHDVIELGLPWSPKINLIATLSLAQIKMMIQKAMGMKTDKDGFWINSSLDIAIPWLDFWREIERFKRHLQTESEKTKDQLQPLIDIFAPIAKHPSLLDLYETFTTYEELKEKAIQLESILDKHDPLKIIGPYQENEKLMAQIYKLYKSFEILYTRMKKFIHIGSGNSTTYINVIMSLHSALENIGLERSFHKDQLRIDKLLDAGKIGILHTQNLGESALAYLSHSIFETFHRRYTTPNPTPISIFLDEVQRILSPQFDLPLEVAREARIDFIMAHQSPSLLIEKIGLEKYYSIKANTATKFIFKTNYPLDEVETKDLERFQYFTSRDTYTTLHTTTYYPFTQEEAFEAEHEHQIMHKIWHNYLFDKPSEPFVLVPAQNLFERGYLLLQLADSSQQEVEFFERIDAIAYIKQLISGYHKEKVDYAKLYPQLKELLES